MSIATLVPIAVLLLIPVVSFAVLIVLDSHIADIVEHKIGEEVRPRVSRLSRWSLIISCLPIVGLLVAVIAILQIHLSRGMLTGLKLAITGLALNILVSLWIIAKIIALNT